jgi:hypothetical protein
MTTYCIGGNGGKDSNATFVNRLRDSSDVTSYLRQQGVRNNYQILQTKSQTIVGGIPANDLYDMAHLTGKTGPYTGLISGVSITTSACVTCTGQLPFNLGKSASLVR